MSWVKRWTSLSFFVQWTNSYDISHHCKAIYYLLCLFVFLLPVCKKMNCYLIQKKFTVKYFPCHLPMLNDHWNYSNAECNFLPLISELLWCYLDCCVKFKIQLLVLALVYQQQMLHHQQMKFLWHNIILIYWLFKL